MQWLVWCSGDHIEHINKVNLNPVSTGIGDLWKFFNPSIYQGHAGCK